MVDAVTFKAPLGSIGVVVERIILRPYLQRLMEKRNRYLRHVVEQEPSGGQD